VLEALHWAEAFSAGGARGRVRWHRCQGAAVLGQGSVGLPGDMGCRHPEESGALAGLAGSDPGAVGSGRAMQKARRDFKNGPVWP